HRGIGKHRQDRPLRGAADLQADRDVLAADGAHRADVEAGIVEPGAGEQQAAAFDAEVLAIRLVFAVDADFAAPGRRLAGPRAHRELSAHGAVEAVALNLHAVAELDVDVRAHRERRDL